MKERSGCALKRSSGAEPDAGVFSARGYAETVWVIRMRVTINKQLHQARMGDTNNEGWPFVQENKNIPGDCRPQIVFFTSAKAPLV